MEEFESFFSQLIPTAEHDIWLMGRDNSVATTSSNWNPLNLSGVLNVQQLQQLQLQQQQQPVQQQNVEYPAQIKEQLQQLQMQQQQQSLQIQQSIANFQNIQNQQFQLRTQQLQAQQPQQSQVPLPTLFGQTPFSIDSSQTPSSQMPGGNTSNSISNSSLVNITPSVNVQQQFQSQLQQQQFPFISSNNSTPNLDSPLVGPQVSSPITNFTTPNFTPSPTLSSTPIFPSPSSNSTPGTTKPKKSKKSNNPKPNKKDKSVNNNNNNSSSSINKTENISPPTTTTISVTTTNEDLYNFGSSPPTNTDIYSDNTSPNNCIGLDSDDESKKKSANRMNQNLASRNYRQRRKDYIKEIENKMAALTFENHQLKKENESLKETGGVEIMRPEPELISMVMEAKQIVVQLSYALKKNDERTMIYLLHLFHCAIAKRYSIIEREVEKIVHPYTQSKIAAMGYVPKTDKWWFMSCFGGPGSDNWFNLYKKEAEITEEQGKQLETLRTQHYKLDQSLIAEREQLDREIKKFYYTKILVLPNNPLEIGDIPCHPYNNEITQTPVLNQPLEISQLLDFAKKLENLKRNFIQHRNIMLDTLASLSSILTPKQEALLLIRVHYYTGYDIGHMELLKEVWGGVVSQNKTTTTQPLNISEALKKMTESTNVVPTIEQIVKPPQFHQYTPKASNPKKTPKPNNSKAKSSKSNHSGSESLSNSNSPSSTSTITPPLSAANEKKYQWVSYPGANQ